MKRCLVISDSFKGTLSSPAICRIARSLAVPGWQVDALPVADGGEGTVDCFLDACGGQRVTAVVSDPFGAEAESFYGLLPDGTAVVECAAAAGLPLAEGRLDPERTTTYGVGQLMAAALVCVPILAAAGWLFARCWRLAADPVYKLLFGALLFYTSVLELLRLWQLAGRLYPGAITLTSVCLLCVLPVVYLRRVSALSQTAHAVLCLLVLVTAVMLVSVLPRLRVTNLQTAPLTQGDFRAAAKDQLTLYPEYLLPALWPEQDKRGRHALLRLAGYTLAFDVGMHLLLELFYGAAMPLRIDPVHAAARCGALSIFNRLEWLQFILWVMAVTVKLALYLYALVRLLGGQSKAENSAAGLDRFPLYLGGIWLLCAVLRKLDLDAALPLRSTMTWGFVVLTWMGGAAACLCKKLRRA